MNTSSVFFWNFIWHVRSNNMERKHDLSNHNLLNECNRSFCQAPGTRPSQPMPSDVEKKIWDN